MAAQRFLCTHTDRERERERVQNKTTMYVKHSIKARAGSHCWRRKAISSIYSECVFVAICIIPNVHEPCYIVICGLTWSAAVSLLSHKRDNFRGEKLFNIVSVV
jgi:hypothetical protein